MLAGTSRLALRATTMTQRRDKLDGVVGQRECLVSVRAEPASHVSGGERERAQSLRWNGLESLREQYSRSRGPPFVRPNSRRVFRHSNTRSTTPSPPRICACESASKHVDQRGVHAVPELQLSRHNAMPPTCVSQSSQTDERRRARRGERTETHAWADVGASCGAFRHTRRQRGAPAEQPSFGGENKYPFCKTHARGS